MAKLTGMGGNIELASNTVPVSKWSVAVKSDVQDVTDTNSGGWQENIGGVKSADLTFSAFWDTSASALSTLFAIGTTLFADLHLGSGMQNVQGNWIVSDFTITNDAKTPITFECTCKSQGEITVPT